MKSSKKSDKKSNKSSTFTTQGKKQKLPNSFLLFSNEQRALVFEEQPGITNSEGMILFVCGSMT